MQKIAKIFILFLCIIVLFSCQQHFYYLKKVKSETVKIETLHNKINHSETLDFKYNFNFQNSNKIFSDKIGDDFLTASIDTPKPYIIKKLPAVEEENLNVNVRAANFSEKNANPNLSKKIIGFLFIIIGGILVLLGVLIFLESGGSSYGCSPILSIIFGIISLIFGLGLAFINY
jgi:ATP-dependent Zn protease